MIAAAMIIFPLRARDATAGRGEREGRDLRVTGASWDVACKRAVCGEHGKAEKREGARGGSRGNGEGERE